MNVSTLLVAVASTPHHYQPVIRTDDGDLPIVAIESENDLLVFRTAAQPAPKAPAPAKPAKATKASKAKAVETPAPAEPTADLNLDDDLAADGE